MARTLPTNILTYSTVMLGMEPIILLEVDWRDIPAKYAFKTMTVGADSYEGIITQFSPLSSEQDNQVFGSIGSASVTLKRTDILYTTFLDTVMIGCNTRVYATYSGLAESVLIFQGKIVGPLNYSDADRTLSFEISSTYDGEDVLLEIKENTSDFPNPKDIGLVLPLCFGDVRRVPAVRLAREPKGDMLSPAFSSTGWYKNNDPSTSKIVNGESPHFFTNWESFPTGTFTLIADNTLFIGHIIDFTTGEFRVLSPGHFNASFGTVNFDDRDEDDVDYTNTCVAWLQSNPSFNPISKYIQCRFKQDYKYVLDSLGNKQIVYADNIVVWDGSTEKPLTVLTYSDYVEYVAQITDYDPVTRKITFSRECKDSFGYPHLLDASDICMATAGKPNYEWNQLPSDNTPLRWDIPPGTEVSVYSNDQDIWVFNSVPTLSVVEVVGRKSSGNYIAIPSSYYDIVLDEEMDVNGVMEHLSYIKFKQPLTWTNVDWSDDQPYVSLSSSIRDNTASDIITWIVNNRTDLTPDATTFADVALDVANYPSNFALFTQIDAISLLKDIGWQSRVGIIFDGATVYLKYLSKATVGYVYTLEPSWINFNTLSIGWDNDTPYTNMEAKWDWNYTPEGERTLKAENNKDLYPHNELNIEIYTYNIQECVQHSVDFWMNRMSNNWIIIRAETFLSSLNCQLFDPVRLSIPNFTTYTGILKSISHDPTNYMITLEIWVPKTNGTGEPYLTDEPVDNDVLDNLTLYDYVYWIYKRIGYKFGKCKNTELMPSVAQPVVVADKQVARAKIVSVQTDFLYCNMLSNDNVAVEKIPQSETNAAKNGTTDTQVTPILVAMAPAMRAMVYLKSQFPITVGPGCVVNSYTRVDANTRNVTGTIDSVARTEQEVVAPKYNVGDIISISYCADGTGVFTSVGKKIYWEDTTSRQWLYSEVL